MASGVSHYLRRYANTSFSWWGDNLANLPADGQPLPAPPAAGVRRNTTLKYRYALNSCVFGYSTPYWNLTRWVREIDLMAMRGVNLVNQHVGGAWVYQRVFQNLGLSRSEVPFPAPTQGPSTGVRGGPVPQGFIDGQRVLQKQIIARLSAFDMAAVCELQYK